MKIYKTFAGALIALAAVAIAPSSARAQVDTSAPIIVKQGKSPQFLRFRGEVLHADSASIIVRDRVDLRIIRTFTYSPKVRDKMSVIIANGGYQYGDRVEIRYKPGAEGIAIDIKGKPSPPL